MAFARQYRHKEIYIYIYIYTYIYIYIYIFLCTYIDIEEPLRRNYSQLVPESLSNYLYYFALFSIEHILHCSLAALRVGFFLLTNQLRVFRFFQLV